MLPLCLRACMPGPPSLFGKIFVDDFFEYLGEPRSIFSDAVFELNGQSPCRAPLPLPHCHFHL